MIDPFANAATELSEGVPALVDTLVRLPLDQERSSTSGYHIAATPCIGLQPPRTDEERETLVAAWLGLLYRYSQQSDIILHWRTDNSGGWRVMRVTDPGAETASKLVARVSEAMEVSSDPATGDTPDARPNVGLDLASEVNGDEIWDHDLRLVAALGHTPQLVYNAELLSAESVERFAENFGRLLRAVREQTQQPIEELPLLGDRELKLVKRTGPAEPEGYLPVPVHVLFERQVAKVPDSVACYHEDKQLTYRELGARSNQLAHHLMASGVEPGTAVGVCLLPSLQPLVAICSIFKAGGVYVPIDPTHPPELIAQMLEEVQPALVLTHSELA
ncbi:MAG: AMP-binding protein, partial [Gammaproteobacteria bacterium]|nr:AMP-binding protein [Gammaproteobacteria bacterium]